MGELEVTGIPKESFPGTMTTHLSDLQTCTEASISYSLGS